jgi:hypothetical protein
MKSSPDSTRLTTREARRIELKTKDERASRRRDAAGTGARLYAFTGVEEHMPMLGFLAWNRGKTFIDSWHTKPESVRRRQSTEL